MPWQCQVLLMLPSDMASAPSTGFDGDGDRIGTYAKFSGPKLRGLRIWPQYHLIYRTKRGCHNHIASVARSPDLTSGNGKTQRQCSTIVTSRLPPGRAHLHLIAFIGHRLPSQTNTCLFCTLCPHSCAPGRISRSVTHPKLLQAKGRDVTPSPP
ncbi:hypothetical protein OsJ_07947 [Oryza sativa Japonica Group]|uniref:Uncharacterized protein n=1 Tax=Oryza sativa subsp. japonica TaxID=39947 RepID=A3AA60_ORYSJ|nr:hypothetical protein OsJ_07947 [Oryza sativa Japonica Group]